MAPYALATGDGTWAAAVHLPLYGERWWWWLTTPPGVLLDPTGAALGNMSVAVTQQELDRLNNEYILDWPGEGNSRALTSSGAWS